MLRFEFLTADVNDLSFLEDLPRPLCFPTVLSVRVEGLLRVEGIAQLVALRGMCFV